MISFGVTALLLALAYRSWLLTSDDEVQDDLEVRGAPTTSATTDIDPHAEDVDPDVAVDDVVTDAAGRP